MSKDLSKFFTSQGALFTAPECARITELGLEQPTIDGQVASRNEAGFRVDASYRSSTIRWLRLDDSTEWIYGRLMGMATRVNEAMFGFEFTGIGESAQFAEYSWSGGFYDWHMDVGPGPIASRKLSITVQLSEPDAYEGGDLELMVSREVSSGSRGLGHVTVFPSFMLHRVAPVTWGVRRSLVLWVGGEPFR